MEFSENAVYEELKPRSVKDIVNQLDKFYSDQASGQSEEKEDGNKSK